MYHAPTETLKKIVTAIKDVRKRFPDIKDEDLSENGAIIYANGNDGTDFDWGCNDRLCEFMVYFREDGPCHGYGFIKAFVQKNDKMKIYVYADGGHHPTEEPTVVSLDEDAAYWLAAAMYLAADKKSLWDRPVSEIDLETVYPSLTTLCVYEEEEEEDEDEEDEVL